MDKKTIEERRAEVAALEEELQRPIGELSEEEIRALLAQRRGRDLLGRQIAATMPGPGRVASEQELLQRIREQDQELYEIRLKKARLGRKPGELLSDEEIEILLEGRPGQAGDVSRAATRLTPEGKGGEREYRG